jgi:N-methylhydantoinase A
MVARELRIAKVIIPRAPGHFSAYGMLMADLRRDFVHTWFTPLAQAPFDEMEKIYSEMEQRGRAGVNHAHVALHEIAVTRGADMRYVGQEHAVSVELPIELFAARDIEGIKRRFDAVHETRYGYSSPGEAAEIVSLRGAVIGVMRKPPLETIEAGTPEPPAAAFGGDRLVYFSDAGYVDTPTYSRSNLAAANRINGPALVEEYASTTVVYPGDVLHVDGFGNLVIDIRRS